MDFFFSENSHPGNGFEWLHEITVVQFDTDFDGPKTRKELLLAAVDYKAVKRESAIEVDPAAQLVDHGNGHFVMDR